MTYAPAVVLLQIALLWVLLVRVYRLAARRDARTPIDDIGFFWLLAFTLYATLPPLSWLLQGGSYGLLSGRLFRLQPEASTVVYLLNIALAYAVGFAWVYTFLRRRVGPPGMATLAYIGDSKMAGALAILLLGTGFGLAFAASGLLRSAESYVDSYAAIAELPLALRQVLKIVGQLQYVATIVFVVGLIQRWPRSGFLFLFYLLSVILSFDPDGSRTGIARAMLSVAIAWHVLIRPISFRACMVGGIGGLVGLLAVGVWRTLSVTGGGLDGFGVGEFDSIWGNAVELWQEKQGGALEVPFAVRFGEFWEFVPSQLLWFEKSSPSIWFLDTFYPYFKEMGGGWAFGALSQAVIGAGIPEALARGAVLGAVAGWLMKWIRKPSKAWWRFPLYLYLLVSAYQSTRDTTFALWGYVIQTVIPGLVAIAIIGAVLAHGSKLSVADKHVA
jgi:hypothetical protein